MHACFCQTQHKLYHFDNIPPHLNSNRLIWSCIILIGTWHMLLLTRLIAHWERPMLNQCRYPNPYTMSRQFGNIRWFHKKCDAWRKEVTHVSCQFKIKQVNQAPTVSKMPMTLLNIVMLYSVVPKTRVASSGKKCVC